MSFGGGGGGSGSIHASTDVALNNPADGDVLTYNGTLAKWQNAIATGGGGAVSSVAGRTGAVVLAAADVSGALAASNNLSDVGSATTARTNLGLGSVNNTSDASKPVSTATQTALNAKADLVSGFVPLTEISAGTTLTVQKSGGTWPARPTSRSDVIVQWKGPDPSPAIVESGTGGMLDNVDVRFVTP